MHTTLEQQDIEAIAEATVEKIKPLLKQKVRMLDDCLLTKDQTAKLLGVTVPWLYNNTIPGKCKIGGHVRYRKSKIIKWIEEQEIPNTSQKVY